MATSTASGRGSSVQADIPRNAVRWALVVLTAINLFNYLDRFFVSALVESLKKSELHLTDTQAGFLASGFIVVYMLTSPLFGALGDKGVRTRLIAIGVAAWSLATVLGGFATGFISLFAARSAVGVGEAAYGTIAPSLIADYFPKAKRGRVFAVFFAAIPIGAALGYIVGGFMDQHFGWRSAFFVAGAPGLVLAFLALRLPEPVRGAQDKGDDDAPTAASHTGIWSVLLTYWDLARNRQYALTILGYAAYTFALGGLAFWMAPFLQRVHGLSAAEATVQFGGIVVVTGFIGTFAGGWLGDYCLKYSRHAYLLVSGIATLLAAPCAWLALSASTPALYYGGLIGAELLMFASSGPVNSAIVNYVAPTQRASAVALSILMIHLLGDVPSPLLIGAISDHGGGTAASLQHAVLIVPVAILIGGIIWTAAALRGPRHATTTPTT